MIAKCTLIALLAVVATALPMGCNNQVVVPTCGSSSSTVVSGAVSGLGSSTGGAITRNIVAKGKYPVALKNCGPTPDKQIQVTTSRLTAPVQEKPTVRLPCNIPAPRTVAHTCTCYKTIVRPRVNQQIITVPTVQRFLQTSHVPVVENIQYEAVPVNCDDSSSNGQVQFVSGSSCGGAQAVQVSSGCSAPVVEIPSGGCSSSCGSVQTVQIPSCSSSCGSVQTVQIPSSGCSSSCGSVQTVQIPSCSSSPVQTIEIPSCSSSPVQTVQLPSSGCSSSCGSLQTIQLPSVGCSSSSSPVQTVQIPTVGCSQSVAPVQTIQIPQTCAQVPQLPAFKVESVQPCFSSCNTCSTC